MKRLANRHGRPVSRLARDRDRSLVPLNNLLYNGHAQPRALGLRREERLKDFHQVLAGDDGTSLETSKGGMEYTVILPVCIYAL